MIEYCEPVPGLDENGNEVTCNQIVRVTSEDAIKIARHVATIICQKRGIEMTLTPQQLLEEFKTVHWASEVKP